MDTSSLRERRERSPSKNGWRRALGGAAVGALVAILAAPVFADDSVIVRENWVPNNDPAGPYVAGFENQATPGRNPDQRLVGDAWTVTCKQAVNITTLVDTKDDTGGGNATFDPHVWIYDGAGVLLQEGDDEEPNCTYPPICGTGSGPGFERFACAKKSFNCAPTSGPYLVMVADSGPLINDIPNGFVRCTGGGGYRLEATVRDKPLAQGGAPVANAASIVAIGGGPVVKGPKWLAATGLLSQPVINDGDLSSQVNLREPGDK